MVLQRLACRDSCGLGVWAMLMKSVRMQLHTLLFHGNIVVVTMCVT